MRVESVISGVPVERNDEREVSDLAREMQVRRVRQPKDPEEGDAFEHAYRPEGKLVWLQEEKKTVYRVIEAETGEIIQQVPSDEVIHVARNIENFLIREDSEVDLQT